MELRYTCGICGRLVKDGVIICSTCVPRDEVKQSVSLEQLWPIAFRGLDRPKLVGDTFFLPHIRARVGSANNAAIRVHVDGNLQRRDGRWLQITRVFDRDHDLYREKYADPRTAEVTYEFEEPLSQHRQERRSLS